MGTIMALRKKRSPGSNVNLSHVSRGTMKPGVVYPVSFVDVLPGDSLVVEPSVFIQSLPLKAALMGSFDICLEMFYSPDRLYNSAQFSNRSGATLDPSKVRYASFTVGKAPTSTTGSVSLDLSPDMVVAPNSLAEFMGLPVGLGSYRDSRLSLPYFSMNRAFTYVDVIRNYYVNQQEVNIPTGHLYQNANGDAISLKPISVLDNFVAASRDPSEYPLDYISEQELFGSYQALFCRTMAPERLETWLNTSNYDLNAGKVSVSVTDNEVILSDVRFGSHVLRYLELAMAGGSRYSDFVEAQFDVEVGPDRNIPVFLGSCRSSLAFDKVLQTSESTVDSPLGNIGGQGAGGEKFRRRRFSFEDHGTFMVCLSLRPRADYSRGVDPMLFKLSLQDKFAPALDRVGFQPLMLAELDALPVGNSSTGSATPPNVRIQGYVDSEGGTDPVQHADPYTQSVGYQPAWSEYMTVQDRLHGKLTTDMRYWALSRLYSSNFVHWTDADPDPDFAPYWQWMQYVYTTNRAISSYVRPDLYNFAFADISPSAENFVYQVALGIRGFRKKSKINMPNFI